MNTIWKFDVPATDTFTLEMPRGAKVLSVHSQGEKVCMWAEVSPGEPKELRTFRTYGTGHDISGDENRSFIGTFLLHGGAFVFHLFELNQG